MIKPALGEGKYITRDGRVATVVGADPFYWTVCVDDQTYAHLHTGNYIGSTMPHELDIRRVRADGKNLFSPIEGFKNAALRVS